jgi:hypothetical protein
MGVPPPEYSQLYEVAPQTDGMLKIYCVPEQAVVCPIRVPGCAGIAQPDKEIL